MSARKKVNFTETVLLSVATAIGLTLLLMIPGAFLLHNGLLPMSAGTVLSAAIAALALFVSGVIFGRQKKWAVATAGITLSVYLLLMLLGGVCVCGGGILSMSFLWQCVSVTMGSALGIMVSISGQKRRKKRIRRA